MSNQTNDELFDRAREAMERETGTILEREIQADLDRDDLDSLRRHVAISEGRAAQGDFEATDAY